MKIIALIVAGLTGYVISHYLISGTAGTYISVFVAYHLFLAFLVAYMDWSDGFQLPVRQAVRVHTGVVLLLIVFSALRPHLPLFGLVEFAVFSIAFLEINWIFGGERKRLVNEALPNLPYTASQADYDEFLIYLKQRGRKFAMPGRTMHEEYGYWLADRVKTKALSQGQNSAAGDSAQSPQS
jgi:hypothetical protein